MISLFSANTNRWKNKWSATILQQTPPVLNCFAHEIVRFAEPQ
jgi:hypothetical protein